MDESLITPIKKYNISNGPFMIKNSSFRLTIFNFLNVLDWALIPLIVETERDDDKEHIQYEHYDAHTFRHFPVERDDCEEDKDQHQE